METVVKMRREYCVINVLQFSKFFVISFVEPAPSVFMTIWAIFTQADDEHSDWPGPEPGLSVMQLTDEEIDPEISFSQVLSLSFFKMWCDSVVPGLYLKSQKPSSSWKIYLSDYLAKRFLNLGFLLYSYLPAHLQENPREGRFALVRGGWKIRQLQVNFSGL